MIVIYYLNKAMESHVPSSRAFDSVWGTSMNSQFLKTIITHISNVFLTKKNKEQNLKFITIKSNLPEKYLQLRRFWQIKTKNM